MSRRTMRRRPERRRRGGTLVPPAVSVVVSGRRAEVPPLHEMIKPGADNTLPRWRRNRRPRLDASVYEHSGYAVHVVTDTRSGLPLFAGPDTARQVCDILHEVAEESDVALLCYCVMPDHVHLLVLVGRGGRSVPQFVKLF